MGKFKLAFGLHNHQPVGNFDHVFEYAHQKAYQAFLNVFQKHSLKISLHQSGILWDWQQKHHPEYIEQVKALVLQGRLELMTGGFYEPILTSVPERDAEGQIRQLNKYLSGQFGVEPDGLWLTERIWEPHLPGLLARAGVKYLPVDDTHFIYAGFEYDQLTGPFVTEHENHRVTLLPISKRLRYLIPFGTIDDVIDELKSLADKNPEGLVVYADDGEKFGSWPQTHEHCYENGWLMDLFEALDKNSYWLEVVPLSVAAAVPPAGRAYLPSSSYAEMLHWSLPPKAFVEYENFENYLKQEKKFEQYGRFVRGGHWRGFLAKYDEANLMHKKMMMVSERLARHDPQGARADDQLTSARSHLYAGQCNCPYWHGVFGGLYLPHIRRAIYANLVEADRILDEIEGLKTARTIVKDYDADGFDEVIIAGRNLSAVFKPSRGGTLLELSLNRHGFSLTDTLTRRKEGYHLKLDKAVAPGESGKTASIHDLVLAKEAGLKELLVEDWYLKRCFIDHFFNGQVDFETFRTGVFREDGDFVLEPYQYTLDKDSDKLVLMRDGHLWRPDGVLDLRVLKSFSFDHDSGTIEVVYEISTPSEKTVEVSFAVENNFNMQAGHHESRYILIDGEQLDDSYLDSAISHRKVHSYTMVDESQSIALALSSQTPCQLWRLPILTVSLSESGFEKVYQGTTFVNRFDLKVSRKPTRLKLRLSAGTKEAILESVRAAMA